MKVKALLAAALVAFGSTAVAQTQDNYTFVRILDAQPNYVAAPIHVPQTHCYNVAVPYTTYHNNSGSVLGGMILGGAAGHIIGGNSRSTATGAIIGGLIAAEQPRRSTHYMSQQQCETVYIQKMEPRADGFIIHYLHKGMTGTILSPVYFQPGSVVSVHDLTTGSRKRF